MISTPMLNEYSSYDPFGRVLAQLFPFFLLLIFIPPVYNTVYLIVTEKETRAKESMRMMGMSDIPYWFSWFVWNMFISTVMITSAWLIIIWNVI